MAKANTKALSCTIDLDNFNVLAELRWVKRVETMSEMVNFAIAEYVELHKDDLPAPAVETVIVPEKDLAKAPKA